MADSLMRQFSRRRSALGFLTVVLVVTAASCSGGGGERQPGVGAPLPKADITSLDGATSLNLADIEGPVVINLWATWCAPCRSEMPIFQQTFLERAAEINFVGLNVAEGSDTAQAFVDELGLSYDQYADPQGRASDALGVIGMPTTVFVDADGVVVSKYTGELNADELNAAIDETLAGK